MTVILKENEFSDSEHRRTLSDGIVLCRERTVMILWSKFVFAVQAGWQIHMFTPNSQSLGQPHGSLVMVYLLKFKLNLGCFRNERDGVNQPTSYCCQRGISRSAHATTMHKYLSKRAPRSRRSRLPARCTTAP